MAVTLTLKISGASLIGGISPQLTGIEAISLTMRAGADRIDTSTLVGNDGVLAGTGNDVVNLDNGMESSN